jgi:hypothetical protein
VPAKDSTVITDAQVEAILRDIEAGFFIGESCEKAGVDRVTFWRLLKARPDLQQAKNAASETGLSIRADEAGRIKWAAYQLLLKDAKYSTIAIWSDKVLFGLRDTMPSAPPPMAVQGLRFVEAVPPAEEVAS